MIEIVVVGCCCDLCAENALGDRPFVGLWRPVQHWLLSGRVASVAIALQSIEAIPPLNSHQLIVLNLHGRPTYALRVDGVGMDEKRVLLA